MDLRNGNISPRTCVCGSAIVIDKGKTLLVKNKKLGVWLNPGGHVDEGETPEEAAVRETLEETGIKVNLISANENSEPVTTKTAHELLKPLSIMEEDVNYATGKHRHFDLIYLAKPDTTYKATNAELETRWIDETEIDGLETLESVKVSLHKVFAKLKTRNFQ